MTIDLSCATRWVTIGFERENLARAQEFDFSAWAEEHGAGVPQLLFQRPGEDTPYPVLLTVEGTTATWTPTATDTAITGEGKAQLSYVVGETVVKNAIFAVLISPSLGASGDPPEGFETWLEELTEMAADAQAAAISAGNAETAAETAQGLAEAARDAAADYAGDAQDAAGDAQAAQRNAEAAESAAEAAEGRAAGYANSAAGSAGTAGDAATAATNAKTAAQTAQGKAEDAQAAAVSAKNAAQAAQAAIEDMTATASVADNVPGTPSVTVTKSEISGHENLDFVFSHVKGAKGDTGSQGVQGPTGPQGPRGYDGSDGQNGVSPTVTVTDISGGHRVTITDADHPTGQSFDVMDGDVGNIDAGDVAYDDEETYPADTVGEAISDVKSALENTAPVIIDSASGAIASFPDGLPRPVVGLSVGVEPVQDLHGYDNPWPGGGGKNKIGLELMEAGSIDKNTGEDTSAPSGQDLYRSDFIPVSASTQMTLSLTGKQFWANVMFYDSSKTYLSYYGPTANTYSETFTTPADCAYVRTYWNVGSERIQKYFDTYKTQLETGASRTTYVSYSNICPITGHTGTVVTRTGKNLWNGTVINGRTPFETKPGVTYTITAKRSDSSAYVYFYLQKHEIGSETYTLVGYIIATTTENVVTFTAEAGYEYNVWSNASYEYVTDVQLEVGPTASAYEPCQAVTIPIDWTDEAGTVYGGELNVLTGVLTVTKVTVDLGTLEWVASSATSGKAAQSKTKPAKGVGSNVVADILSSHYKTENNASAYQGILGICVTSDGAIKVQNPSFDGLDYTQIASALSGVQCVYELATPTTVQLDPATLSTLLGTNNIWATTGDVSVDYRADTKLYINKAIAAAVAAL